MRDRSDADWEELARKEPYFAVLTDERFLSGSLTPDRLREFFASGESDVQHLFDLAYALFSREEAAIQQRREWESEG